MGHRNTQFTGHMIDMEIDQQGHNHPHPEPGIFYGSLPNFPHPNFHSMIPAPANQCNFNFHHMPDHHGSALFYGMPQLNGPQHQHSPSNLDLAISTPSGHYNPYLVAPSGIRDFPVQVNHGTHDQLSLSSANRIGAMPYMDSIRDSFKRKNAEGASGSCHYHNGLAGPSCSIAPVTAMTAESDITMLDTSPILPAEYGGNDPALMVESGNSQRSMRNGPLVIGRQPMLAPNTGRPIQGNFAAPPVQVPGNPWFDVQFGANNGDGTFPWTHAPLHYPHGHAHNPPPPMQGVRGYNINLPSQVVASSHQISGISSSNFHDAVDSGSSFMAPIPPVNFRSYRPSHRREIILDSSARPHHALHIRVLPEDEVAILGIPGYNEAGDSTDRHREMRLDIDHMSYEELLALEEQIGSVGTGLTEEFVQNNLKITIFAPSTAHEEATCMDQQRNVCVICQMDYEDGEEIGTVDCGHEYHRQCVKKWLLTKNTCPVCKSTALSHKAKDL